MLNAYYVLGSTEGSKDDGIGVAQMRGRFSTSCISKISYVTIITPNFNFVIITTCPSITSPGEGKTQLAFVEVKLDTVDDKENRNTTNRLPKHDEFLAILNQSANAHQTMMK